MCCKFCPFSTAFDIFSTTLVGSNIRIDSLVNLRNSYTRTLVRVESIETFERGMHNNMRKTVRQTMT